MRLFGGLTVQTEVTDQRAEVSLHGSATIGAEDVGLRKAIRDLLDQGVTDFVIDLGDLPTIDSSVMAELVAAYRDVTNREGTLELRGLDLSNFPDFPNFPDGFAF